MLSRLSKEIDTVESSTSPQSKPLDRDRDGCITADELEQAKSFLRDKLQSEDMKQLLQEAGVLNSDGSIRVQDLHRVAAQGRDEDDD
jgi:Ca2+-binding EF-hand superfamily protein